MAKTTKTKAAKAKVTKAQPKRPYRKKRYPAEKKYVCDVCGNRYYFQSKLKEHSYIHTNERPFKCDKCDKGFNSYHSLKTHKYIHSDEKPFSCSYCSYACRDSSTLTKHQRNMHLGTSRVFRCKMCDKSFKHRWILRHHVSEKHLKLDIRRLQCDHCGKKFKTKSLLTVHMQNVHLRMRACKCPVCDKTISNRHNLRQHLMTHTDHKPYLCPVKGCDKRFNCSSSLQKHRVRHFPHEQHECAQCGHLFPRASLLKRHFAVIHAERVKVICDYCGVSFISKAYLTNHIQRKHTKKKKKYICDICGFKTYNKPSLVMHIKHGHGNEKDRECKFCHTIYRRHAYLKSHYRKTHNIIYKTKIRKPKPPSPVPLEIKEEPLDLDEPIDLFEIEKEEEESDLVEDEGRQVIESYNNNVNSVPRDVFDRFYVKCGTDDVEDKSKDSKLGHKTKYKLDVTTKEEAEKSIDKLMELARLSGYNAKTVDCHRETREEEVELLSSGKKANKIKQLKRAKVMRKNNKESSQNNGEEQSDLEESAQNNGESSQNSGETSQNSGECSQNSGECSQNSGESSQKRPRRNATRKNVYKENVRDNEDSDYEPNKTGNKKSNLIFNTHQCYVCFKLFDTKDKLLDHCKEHFDICNEKSWKKCPLCEYVSSKHLARHLKLVHDIHIRMPSTIHDKKNNNEGCRYYLKVDNPVIKKIEIIPSIKNLNKMASLKIDRQNRKNNDVGLTKTKLVRKGKEWVVEKEAVNIKKSDFVLPELEELSKGDRESYFAGLRKLYQESKKNGKKIVFPCQHCDKICQNFSALKLHYRKHDPNAKPFAPKVWKHKLKNQTKDGETSSKNNGEDKRISRRKTKPQPIRNKHKCSPELQEFYEKNIRGGNIEFWQFLKIFNRLSKDNVNDFKNLKEGYDYGTGRYINDEANNVTENNESVTDVTETATAEKEKTVAKTNESQCSTNSNYEKINKRLTDTGKKVERSGSINNRKKITENVVKNHSSYKRAIGISKKQFLERELLKNELRRKYATKVSCQE